jgi:hypothetical protein
MCCFATWEAEVLSVWLPEGVDGEIKQLKDIKKIDMTKKYLRNI